MMPPGPSCQLPARASLSHLHPPAEAADEVPAAGVGAAGAGGVAGAEQLPVPDHPRIGREFAPEFVAHAEADFAGAEAGADAAIRIVLARQAELDERLQDQCAASAAGRARPRCAPRCGPTGRRTRSPARRSNCGARPWTPIANQVCDGWRPRVEAHAGDDLPPAAERRGRTGLALRPYRESRQPPRPRCGPGGDCDRRRSTSGCPSAIPARRARTAPRTDRTAPGS